MPAHDFPEVQELFALHFHQRLQIEFVSARLANQRGFQPAPVQAFPTAGPGLSVRQAPYREPFIPLRHSPDYNSLPHTRTRLIERRSTNRSREGDRVLA